VTLRCSHNAVLDVNTQLHPHVLVPIGTQWQNNSCAYDAVCMVLFNVWHEDPAETMQSWNELDNEILNSLTTAFNSHVDIHTGLTSHSLEEICDEFRRRLEIIDSSEFPFGDYASVHAIID